MMKEERNIANIFFPYTTSGVEDLDLHEGLLVGFNFEGFLFVIVSVVSFDSIPKDTNTQEALPELLNQVIKETKFCAFNQHCAGELIILGVIENATNSSSVLPRQVLDFKANQNIWLNIQIQKGSEVTLVLKDLIVCEYKYKVIPHFIYYPRLADG